MGKYIYDSKEVEKLKQLENKYSEKKANFYFFGNILKIGTFINIALLMFLFIGRIPSSLTRNLAELIFLTVFWCGATCSKFLIKISFSYNEKIGTGQPYRGLLFVFSAFVCGVILCYLI